jgi:PAS domain S-box-containing protein
MRRLKDLLVGLFGTRRQSEEKYRILFEQASDAILISDRNGRILESNASASQLFGYAHHQLAMLNLADLYCRKDCLDASLQYQGLLTHKIVRTEISIIHKDLHKVPVEATTRLLSDGRFMAILRDISERKKEEDRIAKAIMEAEEKERLHIGQELHDNINQILASAHMTLHAARDYYPDIAKTHELITLSRNRIEEALIEIRQLSHQLAPAVPDGALLKDVFLELLNGIEVRKRFKIDFKFDDKLNDVANETVMLNLFRILQEQLKNIIKYSEARHIAINVTVCEKYISFTIRDNGRGFDIRSVKKGIGLNNIRKRVEALSGKFTLLTAPGEGCMLIAEIPF